MPKLNDEQIKHMVDRFLMWKLPEDFHPDGGVTFEREYRGYGGTMHKCEPIGTNVLTAIQAKAMVLHMLEGLPE